MGNATFVTLDESRLVEVVDPEGDSHLSNFYFGAPRTDTSTPQAFRAQLGTNFETRAHFHHVDQFQLFFGSPGSYFQRHEIGPLLAHYADADTLYGPFGTGDQPLVLMTLRARGSSFRGVMPDDRSQLPPSRTRRHHSDSLAEWIAEPLPSERASTSHALVEEPEDRLAMFAVEAGPNTLIELPSPSGSGGQYLIVIQGALLSGTRRLPELTVGWIDADADVPAVRAAEAGVRLLVLQFGRSTLAERSRAQSSIAV